jgi:methylenetetrahydrofolate reductase (NADPH)
MKSQKRYPQVVSCEFFPPADDAGRERLREVHRQLNAELKPEFFSVTYGAGGSTRDRTLEAVLDIQRNGNAQAAPHLTCIGATRAEMRSLLNAYRERGIRRIVALRGDRPPGAGPSVGGELRYASELVAFIRAETGDYFHIEVAAYPEFHPTAPNPDQDLSNFKRKVEAGADSAITQYFYNADAYFRFIDGCEKLGVNLPVVPGIMPITNFKQLTRFSDQCGAEIPRWIRQRLEAFGEDQDGLRAFGIDVVSELCRRLLEQGAPGLHFYTMNRVEATLAIGRNLGLIR